MDGYLERLNKGAVLEFGSLRLSKDLLELPGKSLKINTLKNVCLEANEDVKLMHYGHTKEAILLEKESLLEHRLFVTLLDQLIEQVPALERRSVATGFPDGSIGDISVRIGTDVRELYLDGYTQMDIHEVLQGKLSLNELLQQGPTKK